MIDAASYARQAIELIRREVGEDCAVVAVSGGVDSSTAAVLAKRALGDRLHPVFINTGFMRLGEDVKVPRLLSKLLPNLEVIDAREEFYRECFGVADAEVKRIKFRHVFYKVLSRFAEKVGCSTLIQGTIAPDVIETVGGIKTQHNVLSDIGLDPLRNYGFRVVEPLKTLYKDQVRVLARYLGLPNEIVHRQPFPGPGLLVRCVGACNPEKLQVLRVTNFIFTRLCEEHGWTPSQYFVAVWEHEYDDIVLEFLEAKAYRVKATGVKGDARAYGRVYATIVPPRKAVEAMLWAKLVTADRDATRLVSTLWSERDKGYVVAIRAVNTNDFMTADVALPPAKLLDDIVEALSHVKGVSEIVFDVTPKPPATIEFE